MAGFVFRWVAIHKSISAIGAGTEFVWMSLVAANLTQVSVNPGAEAKTLATGSSKISRPVPWLPGLISVR